MSLEALLSEDHGPIDEVRTEGVRKFPRLRIIFHRHGELTRPYELTSQEEARFCFELISRYMLYYTSYLMWLKHFNIEFGVRYSRVQLIRNTFGRHALPEEAIEKWPGKWHSKEDADVFFRRVWGPFLKQDLCMSYLRRVDLSLYYTINKFSKIYKRPWPSDLKIANERSKLANAMDRLYSDGASHLTPKELIAVGRKLARESSAPKSAIQ